MDRSTATTAALRIFEVVGAVGIWCITIYTVGNVVARAAGFGPLPAVIELITRWWMVPLVFAGWGLAYVAREHISVDVVPDRSSGIPGAVLVGMKYALDLLFLTLIIVGAWAGAQQNRMRGEYGIDTGAPVWTTRYVLVALAVLTLLYLVVHVVVSLRRATASNAGAGTGG